VVLVSGGAARLYAETAVRTAFHRRRPAAAPVRPRHAVGGAEGVCRAVPEAGATGAVSGRTRPPLLFDAGEGGQAFRRVALSGSRRRFEPRLPRSSRFFDAPAESGGTSAALRDAPPVEEHPIDPDHAGALSKRPASTPPSSPRSASWPEDCCPERRWRGGAPGQEAFILAEGRLRVSVDIPGAGEEALAILRSGEIAGEMSLVDDAPRSANLYAHNGPATVYVLSRDVFRRLLKSGDPQGAPLLAGIAVVLARRLEEALKKSAGFRILSGPI